MPLVYHSIVAKKCPADERSVHLASSLQVHSCKRPIDVYSQTGYANLRQVHINFLAAMHTGHQSTVYDWKIYLRRQQTVNAAFRGACIN